LTITEGDSATFSVTATGTGTLSYQWLANGTPITDATESTLTIGIVALSESGTEFAVQVSDTGGSITSDAATLTVEPAVTLTITTHPEDLTIAEGDSATFSVTTTGTGTLIYQWLANGTPITDATESTLTLSTVALGENATEFAVQVSDTGESITSDTATLTVDPVPVPLAISAQPSDLTIVEGNNATFSVTATGTGTLSYQWLANGIPITDATESTLTLSAVALSESGTEFAVQVSDNGESMTSDTATLQVTEAVSPVTVMTLGQGTLDSDKNDGPRFVRLHFEVFASVEHTISVTWDSDADLRFNILRADGSRLNPTTIRGSNPGVWVGELDANEQYNIGLWSVNGSANYTATVSASIPLTIQNQPSNVVVSEGQDARFSVAAVGSSAITYQWFADENPIPGEIEDTLTVFATTLSENGSGYRVEVSDGADTITSDVATLSVREPTTFGPYSQASDTSTWMLNGPAPTLDFNVSVANAAWGRVLLRIGDILLVGGDFTGIRQNRGSQITDRPWLAAFNAVSGQPESSFQVPPQIDSVVRALTLSPSGSEVYVGGDFGFLVLDAVTGELNNSVSVDDGQAVGRVFDIAVTQTQLYIGGDFTHVDNTFRKNVARLSLDGQLDETWNPRINTGISTGREAPVQAVTVSPSGATVYLGGSFRDIDDTAVPLSNQGTTVSMLALDASEGASVQPERFTPNVTLRIEKPVKVHDILVTDDYVIVAWGGPNYLTFHALDGTRLRQYQATGDVQALKIAGNQLFVGHHGEYFGDILSPIPQESIQSIDPEIVTPFKIHSFRIDDPTFPPEQSWSIRGTFGVWGISVAEDSLWVAGQIVRAGSNGREVDGLARFPALE